MQRSKTLRILVFAVVLSSAAPALLAANGVLDPDLLVVVFAPSVVVGVASAWYARRPAATAKAWAYGSRRMP